MTTIREVATRAAVSIATVSRVVNSNRPVGPEVRARVLKAVEELDYRPNYLARGLRQRNTCMIGLIIPDNSNPFYAELARAIEDAGFNAGYSVILCNTDLSEEKQQAYIDVLLSHQVDGVILVDMHSTPLKSFGRILAEHIPAVLTNSYASLPDIDQVMVDDYQGSYMAGQYLLCLNHRRIGCIAYTQPLAYNASRLEGFRQALADAGIELSSESISTGNGRYESGYKGMQELIRRCPDLTAAFIFNDLMAFGAINGLRGLNIHVPEDFSIIGFDNIFYSSIFDPALTTIAQPISAMGQKCITQLLDRIHQPEKPSEYYMLPATLIERASCKYLSVSEL